MGVGQSWASPLVPRETQLHGEQKWAASPGLLGLGEREARHRVLPQAIPSSHELPATILTLHKFLPGLWC